MADRLQEAKARQVYLVLRDRIMSGAVNFGTRFPNENDLAEAHGVSRVTVRRALAELERERLIDRRRSAGTRVVWRSQQEKLVGAAANGPQVTRQFIRQVEADRHSINLSQNLSKREEHRVEH